MFTYDMKGAILNLGPLHKRAKSRDHDIVRAQKKCPKAILRHFQNHVVQSRVFKWSVKSKCPGYFEEKIIHHNHMLQLIHCNRC